MKYTICGKVEAATTDYLQSSIWELKDDMIDTYNYIIMYRNQMQKNKSVKTLYLEKSKHMRILKYVKNIMINELKRRGLIKKGAWNV